MSPALYLIDTSGLFGILQGDLRKAWSDQLVAGVIAICPIVELEFLFSSRSLADRLEKQQLMHDLFGWVPMPRGHTSAQVRSSRCLLKVECTGRRGDLLIAATAGVRDRFAMIVITDDREADRRAGKIGDDI